MSDVLTRQLSEGCMIRYGGATGRGAAVSTLAPIAHGTAWKRLEYIARYSLVTRCQIETRAGERNLLETCEGCSEFK